MLGAGVNIRGKHEKNHAVADLDPDIALLN